MPVLSIELVSYSGGSAMDLLDFDRPGRKQEPGSWVIRCTSVGAMTMRTPALSTIALLVFLWLTTAANMSAQAAQVRPLDSDAAHAVFAGNTIDMVVVGTRRAILYLAPGGPLRGIYEGKRVDGRWWIAKNGELCFELPHTGADGCRRVVPERVSKATVEGKGAEAGEYQLFTPAGEPAGELTVSKGNPYSY